MWLPDVISRTVFHMFHQIFIFDFKFQTFQGNYQSYLEKVSQVTTPIASILVHLRIRTFHQQIHYFTMTFHVWKHLKRKRYFVYRYTISLDEECIRLPKCDMDNRKENSRSKRILCLFSNES